MRRFTSLLVAAVAVVGAVGSSGAAAGDDHGLLNCGEGRFVCAETASTRSATRADTPGTTSPRCSSTRTRRDRATRTSTGCSCRPTRRCSRRRTARAATWNFQLRPAFWLGMALCDNQSAPEFTHAPCTPDSDTNIFDGTRPGGARLHRQASGNGVPRAPVLSARAGLRGRPASAATRRSGVSRWRSSASTRTEHRHDNNGSCLDTVGPEPVNFAFVTTSGTPHAPPSPLGATLATFTPSATTDLFMDSGDVLAIDIHDGAAGLTAIVNDVTSGQSGSMTASAANGFAQVTVRADRRRRATRPRTRSGPCTRPRASTRGCRGRRTATTSPSRTRSGTSSTATP